MKYLTLTITSVLLFTTHGYAANKVTDLFCTFKKNGSEVFLKISEINDANGNTVSASAELTVGDGAAESIPELKKISTTEIPGRSFHVILKWAAPQFEIMISQDHSFPSRNYPADLILANQPKIRGVCEF